MPASRWTTTVVYACLLGAPVVGCQSREKAFRATRIPVARLDSLLAAADSVRLPLAAARALLGVVAESGFAVKLPHDTMTIAEILAWADAERARKRVADAAATAAERVRQDSVKKLLEPLLAVTVVKKSYLPRNPDAEQYEDYISLGFAYQNKGTKAIRAFQGDARREPARIVRVNPFRLAHQRLRDTPLDKMKLVWQSTDVVFADGSRLSVTADRAEQ